MRHPATLLLFLLLFSLVFAASCPWDAPSKPSGSPTELLAKILNFGVICFGNKHADCFLRIGSQPLFEFEPLPNCIVNFSYIALIDVLLLLSFIFFLRSRNIIPFLILFVLLIIVFAF